MPRFVTRTDGVVVDTFQVDRSRLSRRAACGAAASRWVDRSRSVFDGRAAVEAVCGAGRRLSLAASLPAARQATEVRIDNETSDRYTIIDVFADDRQGLLYVITNAIFQLGLSVHAARISTRLDQVADVFYVTDTQGKKVEEAGRLESIRASGCLEGDRTVSRSVKAA